MNFKRKTGYFFWAVIILNLIAMTLFCSCSAESRAEVMASRMRVEVATVKKSRKSLNRRYAGYTHPAEATGVGFMVAGRVKSIRVKEGDVVAEGQLLATLNGKDYALMKQLSDIQVGTLAPNVTRLQNLVNKKVLPRSRLDELQGEYDAAIIQEEQARQQLTYTRLKAPVSGVVHEIMGAEGQVIGQGMPVVALLDLSSIDVKIGIPQQDLRLFRKGESHTITVAGMDMPFEAVVTHIDYVSDVQTRTFDVTLSINNEAGKLRPGMMAWLQIPTRTTEGYFVPLHAIGQNMDGAPEVKLVNPRTRRVRVQEVTLGEVFGEEVAVTRGLEQGLSYIVRGMEFVKDGEEVRLK